MHLRAEVQTWHTLKGDASAAGNELWSLGSHVVGRSGRGVVMVCCTVIDGVPNESLGTERTRKRVRPQANRGLSGWARPEGVWGQAAVNRSLLQAGLDGW